MAVDKNNDNDIVLDTVVTCFPQRRECGLDDPDRYDMTDVLENVVQNINSDFSTAKSASRSSKIPPTSNYLVGLIINECVRTCFDPMKNLEDDFKFLDMFSNSISSIVSLLAGKNIALD